MEQRIIPARAGNAAGSGSSVGRHADHPRAGGERLVAGDIGAWNSGSSPRGRGTRPAPARASGAMRIIPARAGNASSATPATPPATDHPRAGGERSIRRDPDYRGGGSSPRGRGTLALDAGDLGHSRIIPARAGNASTTSRSCDRPADHPRAGGERSPSMRATWGIVGSSPRGRGTPLRLRGPAIGRRIIPARAGNACRAAGGRTSGPDHPRAGGERTDTDDDGIMTDGSSPRGRGTPSCWHRDLAAHRIIPARAGNARPARGGWPWSPDHPRAGGERLAGTERIRSPVGSSPRGRGTLDPRAAGGLGHRIIPARAGNAWRGRRGSGLPSDHPRAGGERRSQPHAIDAPLGSSPRGRGTRRRRRHRAAGRRIIPARAGNAAPRQALGLLPPDHPRAGGERTPRRSASSP